MNLETIKFYCEKQGVAIKQLANDVGMSEPNLHRCIRLNKIQAQDLENIAILLKVDIREFFDEKAIINDSQTSSKDAELVALSRELIDVIGRIMNLNNKE